MWELEFNKNRESEPYWSQRVWWSKEYQDWMSYARTNESDYLILLEEDYTNRAPIPNCFDTITLNSITDK